MARTRTGAFAGTVMALGWVLGVGCSPEPAAFELTLQLVFPPNQAPLDGVDILQLDIDYDDGQHYAFYQEPSETLEWELERIPGVDEGEFVRFTFRGLAGDPADPDNVLELANGVSAQVDLAVDEEVAVYFSSRGRFGEVSGGLPSARVLPQVAPLPGGGALIFGGMTEAGDEPAYGIDRLTWGNEGYEFVEIDESYHRLGATVARIEAADSPYHDQVLIIGGWEDAVSGVDVVSKVDRYDPATDSLSTVFDMPLALASCAVHAIEDGRLLLSGGLDTFGGTVGINDRYVVVDTLVGEAFETGSMNRARYDHRVIVGLEGAVISCGGYRDGPSGDITTADCESWTSGEVASLPPLVEARAAFGMAPLAGEPAGRMVAFGGWQQDEASDPVALDSAEVYDPETASWTTLEARMVEARAGIEALALTDGRVLACGGVGSDGEPLDSCEAFDPGSEAFVPLPDLVLAGGRANLGLVALDPGLVLFVGGAGEQPTDAVLLNP